jgi:hypothetical protein
MPWLGAGFRLCRRRKVEVGFLWCDLVLVWFLHCLGTSVPGLLHYVLICMLHTRDLFGAR